jgi:hypothetical protein
MSELKRICDETDLLSKEDGKALQSLEAELNNTLHKRQIFRTETEMRFSVLNDGKFPTKASKYWQAVREQAAMLDSVITQGFEYRRLQNKVNKIKRDIEACDDELDMIDSKIDLDEAQYNKMALHLMAADRIRELKLWSQIKSEVDDGSFDTENCDTHQAVSMEEQLIHRKNCLTQGASQGEVINVLGPLQSISKHNQKNTKNQKMAVNAGS